MAYSSITKPEDYFNTTIWSGNNTSPRTITTNVDNDLVWVKNRSHAYSHYWLDSVRGVGTSSDGKQLRSDSNSANITATSNGYISGLGNTGFTLTTGSSDFERLNANGMTYCAWTWRANGQGSSNTDGSTNTTYTSVNTTAGFSISTYAGSGSLATIGHGLGVAPKVVLIKSTSHTENWVMYHASLGAGKYIYLNNADGAGPGSGTNTSIFNNTAPTSSVFTVNTDGTSNGSGKNYVAYCFAEKTGYSKFGSYTGNGNTDGMFVYTGFKPALIILKHSNSNGNNWRIIDNKRDPDNVTQKELYPSTNDAEGSSDRMDLLSNGFKLRSSGSPVNDGEYIYMAFGQSLVGSNNVPCTAR